MARYVVILVFGAILGGGAVFVSLQGDGPPAASGGSDMAVPEAVDDAPRASENGAGMLSAAARFARDGDELAALAERDPAAAIAEALARDSDSLRRMLLIRAGEGAARHDPAAALAQAAAIDDLELRSGFTLGILNTWAALDPAGLLEYLKTVGPNDIRAAVPFDRLVLGDPEAVLDQLDEYSGVIRTGLEREALLALAETDAIGTLARLDGMPSGPNKQRLILAVAETYGRQDPSAALAWATSLSPPSQQALVGVVSGIATTDINQAIDWVLREVEAPTLSGLDAANALPITEIFQGLRNGAIQMPQTAARLLETRNTTLKSRATAALMVWAQGYPNEAVDFALSRLDQLDPDDLTSLAMQTAGSAPDVAAQTADRLPPEYRATWVAGVADALVRTRPQRALDYLAGQRGRPGYGEGVLAVVRQLAPTDPATAATLVTDSAPSPQIINAARVVAAAWANDDGGAARQWVFGLPSGETRDAGIVGMLTASTRAGEFDATLLDAIASDATRQQAASSAILQIGRTNQVRARELIQSYVTEPAQREQLEQQLTQIARLGAAGANVPRLPTINFEQ